MDRLFIYTDIVIVFATVSSLIYLTISKLDINRTPRAAGAVIAGIAWILTRVA